MSADQISFTFTCSKCGGKVLELPDNYADDSNAVCKACRTDFGKWGDIKSKAKEEAAQHVRKVFRDAFKGIKGVTFK